MSVNEKSLLRCLDFSIALLLLLFSFPFLVLIFLLNLIFTKKPIFTQKRVGENEKNFTIFKFRTMKDNVQDCPTHMLSSSEVTSIGKYLRKYKVDELPQLVNVLLGNMSFVGPRPCLPGQTELIKLRREEKLFLMMPGITGLAQIEGIDMSIPSQLVSKECIMRDSYSLKKYIYYIIGTFLGRGFGDNVR